MYMYLGRVGMRCWPAHLLMLGQSGRRTDEIGSRSVAIAVAADFRFHYYLTWYTLIAR